MPRPQSKNPSPRALYLRKLRDSKLTPEERQKQEIKREILNLYQNVPEWQMARRKLDRQKRLWRAWKMWDLAAKDALQTHKGEFFMPIKGQSESMTWEQAIFILSGEGNPNYPNLLEQHGLKPGDPRPRNPDQFGVPKRKSYLKDDGTVDQTGLCSTLRKLCEAQGIQPKTPDLEGSGKQRYEKSKPVFTGYATMKAEDNLGDSPKLNIPVPYHRRENVKARKREEYHRRKERCGFTKPLTMPTGLEAPEPPPSPKPQPEEDPALARLKSLAASHKALEEEPSDDIFGDWQDK